MTSVIIPALDEGATIASVVREIPRQWAGEIIVVDNGSSDRTADEAESAGARVVLEPHRGYGRACTAGVRALAPGTTVVVFLDGDGSDCPDLIGSLVRPILEDRADFVIGSRTRGVRERGSLTFQQVLAGRLFGFLVRLVYGFQYTDMGPFRAIRRDCLDRLGMSEQTYGWNLEMQMKALRHGLRVMEIPVNHRCRRGGESKVSGTVRGTVLAAARIFLTFVRVAGNN